LAPGGAGLALDIYGRHRELVRSLVLSGAYAGWRGAARDMMLDVRPAGALSMLTAFANADLRAVLPTIGVPTLLIYGAEDVRAPREVAEALHAQIPASRLILVPGAGHDVNLEAPEEYAAAVRSFLRTASEPPELQNR
jgi:pimeloyl-ACP methyl ester carboxylesterase